MIWFLWMGSVCIAFTLGLFTCAIFQLAKEADERSRRG